MFRALAAFLALPGIVAGLIPALLMLLPDVGWFRSPYAVLCGAVGLVILAACTVTFYRRGSGTLAPWDPPKRLVVEGLYRYNRNPMYVGVLLILAGWAVFLGSAWHYAYAVFMALVFHLRVVLYEEPEMQRRFPQDWDDYKQHVPRWLIRLRPYRSPAGSSGR